MNGQEAVNLTVKKRAGENILRIVGRIDRIIDAKKALWPAGIEVTRLMDQSRDIRLMVSDLENNILSGLSW